MTEEIVLCEITPDVERLIGRYAEALKSGAHTLGDHGLDEDEFRRIGLFRAAVERIRGQFSAAMEEKRQFVGAVLDSLRDHDFISSWQSSGSDNRFDYEVALTSGKTAVIELKGCLDGNNTNIFERPANADEFIIWSVCTNPGADPRKNVWSGIHTRLSAEIISNAKRVDGLIVWDMVCATMGRPCPKVTADPGRLTQVGTYSVPPPCIYLFPSTVPSVRNNAKPVAQAIGSVEILEAFHRCFAGRDDELSSVDFEIAHRGDETVRTTRVRRNGSIVKESGATPIRRK